MLFSNGGVHNEIISSEALQECEEAAAADLEDVCFTVAGEFTDT
jgi:hypothetical protein